METQNITLKERWDALKAENPKLRIRNAAEELGVSEAELLVTLTGSSVTRLNPDFPAILGEVEKLGYVIALTRNDDVVHERKGVYQNASFGPHASLFVGEDIDLRIFLMNWAHAFAVTEADRSSLQFFGKNGVAMHKIYLTEKSNSDVFAEIVSAFESDDQSTEISIDNTVKEVIELPDEEIDQKGFQESWVNLKDTHAFFGLTRKYKVTRTQALRLAPAGNYAVKVENTALRELFTTISEQEIPIMVFVGNEGIIQIHTGNVKKIVDFGEWFNVLDPEFNLHLKEPAITESWIVRKPTEDGIVTSLEIFNEKKEAIATIFGKRKPGIPELTEWQNAVQAVEDKLAVNLHV
ncbi:MAG: hemin-degrading factor [Cytophagales bacterium]|nr:hemin-degrading factor [Cytophagales bacterium]